MKKIILKTLSLATFVILMGISSFAQIASKSTGSKETVKTTESGLSAESSGIAARNVSAKVQRSFVKFFKSAEEASWSTSSADYIADFHMADRHVLAWFTKSGYNYCTIYYGQEKHLPAAEKLLVNTAYDGFDITATQEIRTTAGTSWVVTLQDCKKILQVKLDDDAITELSHVQRSK